MLCSCTNLIFVSAVLPTTATESVLPWKRDDSDVQLPAVAMQQREFPAWINNKDYVNYSSPSNTLLGNTSKICYTVGDFGPKQTSVLAR